jgi:CheY-like chemotaxis protein
MDVTTADDGDVAVRLLIDSYAEGARPFSLVLMDMQACWLDHCMSCCFSALLLRAIALRPQMPRLDGLQATKQFRAWERQARPQQRLPVIALSANVFDEAMAACSDAGMDGACARRCADGDTAGCADRVLMR